jgi:hypothetical protein
VETHAVDEEEARRRLRSICRHAFERLNPCAPIHHPDLGIAFKEETLDRLVDQIFPTEDPN